MADDLYEGFSRTPAGNEAAGNSFLLSTSYGKPAAAKHRLTTGFPVKDQTSPDPTSVRPMTSKKGAGFSSQRPVSSAGISADGVAGRRADSKQTPEVPLEEQIKQLESKISQLLDLSYAASSSNRLEGALSKAKESYKKDRQVMKLREQLGTADSSSTAAGPNLDLSYCVMLNLANQYHESKMYPEALAMYQQIVKSKHFSQASRLRVNMGNIYFEQQNYAQAIKMYRMSLDQLPMHHQKLRLKVLYNIGTALIRLGQHQDAIQCFQTIMESSPDHRTGYNLLLCHYTLGDVEGIKRTFSSLISIPIPAVDEAQDQMIDQALDDHDVFMNDELRHLDRQRAHTCIKYIAFGARLIAPALGDTFEEGFEWILQSVKSSSVAQVADELEIGRATHYMKEKNFSKAFEAFEKKDATMLGVAATNLSFLFEREGQLGEAEKYAQKAVQLDRYNAKAMNNLGNCFFRRGEFEKAKAQYSEALGMDAECTEAVYNMGLTCKRLGSYAEALVYFEKLLLVLPDNADATYQMADIRDKLDNWKMSLDSFKRLISIVPTDPTVLSYLADLYQRRNDRSEAFHYFSESYRYLPSSLDVIAWLGAYYVESEVYEQALSYFEKAAVIQPSEIKWQLMMASCHRRSGNYPMALELYKEIHEQFPDSADCLRFLIRVCTDMDLKREAKDYIGKLSALEERMKNQGLSIANATATTLSSNPNINSKENTVSSGIGAAVGGPAEAKERPAPKADDIQWDNEDVDELLAF